MRKVKVTVPKRTNAFFSSMGIVRSLIRLSLSVPKQSPRLFNKAKPLPWSSRPPGWREPARYNLKASQVLLGSETGKINGSLTISFRMGNI
jgi:hypothetical protein